jgi:hypothetical protein
MRLKKEAIGPSRPFLAVLLKGRPSKNYYKTCMRLWRAVFHRYSEAPDRWPDIKTWIKKLIVVTKPEVVNLTTIWP